MQEKCYFIHKYFLVLVTPPWESIIVLPVYPYPCGIT
jgi:hypothetical protein